MAKKKEIEAQLTRFEKYEFCEVHRHQISNAPYNPRMIGDKERRKLKENLARVGLLEPLVWNRRTGNIVSGHQRIAILDQLEKSSDYKIHVAAVDLDEKTEKEQNLFFNNPLAQGDFDSEKLPALLGEIGIDNTGFDSADMAIYLGSDGNTMTGEALGALSNEMHKAIDAFDKAASGSSAENDPNFYLVVIFRTHEERVQFTARLHLDDNCYVDGRDLAAMWEDRPQTDVVARARARAPRAGG